MDDYKKLVEIMGICYEKAKNRAEVIAIDNFITKINKLKKEGRLDLIKLSKELDELLENQKKKYESEEN